MEHCNGALRIAIQRRVGVAYTRRQMGYAMQVIDIYANLSDNILLRCPGCQRKKAMPATTLQHVPQPLTVRCPCLTGFQVRVIIRQAYRKPTKLAGTYTKIDASTRQIVEQGRMTVQDLSRSGAGLRTLYKHRLAVDDVLSMTFTLDNVQQTKIEIQGRVRWIAAQRVGVEFVDQDTYTEANRLLRFYLIPQQGA